jgi:hypothetical protein
MLFVDARVQSRLGTIDIGAKALPKLAARERWNQSLLDYIQCPDQSALVEHRAVWFVSHHASLGRRPRMSRDETAPSR